jgi:YVTN family beta-propeller protein
MLTRRALFALPLLAACGRRRKGAGFRGYAFVANQDSQSIAAVDLEVLAVARHIPITGSPTQILTAPSRPTIYALTAGNGTVHEISVDRLSFTRKLTVASSAIRMEVAQDDSAIYILAREPKALIKVRLDSFNVDWKLPLSEVPVDFSLAPESEHTPPTAAVSFHSGVRLIDLAQRRLREPALSSGDGAGDFGPVRFLADSKTLIAANRGQDQLALFDVASSRLISNLPLSVRPDYLCFNSDGGQLFVAGAGMDAVVVVYPYHTPVVAGTILAGHVPGAMAASRQYIFVANPQSANVSIIEVASRRMIAAVSVGSEPACITITPDDQYALVLNRVSGDVSVLRVGAITKNRDRRASLLTVIPVGSSPVSAVVRAV